MALIVEDGSNVANANSYNTVAEIRTFASLRGLSLPVDDSDVEILAIKATDYLEGFRDKYRGSKTNVGQALQFPRIGVTVDGQLIDSDVIPQVLKDAHAMASIEANTTDLLPDAVQSVKKKKVDVIEIEYQDSTSSRSKGFAKVDIYLDPLLRSSSYPVRSNRA